MRGLRRCLLLAALGLCLLAPAFPAGAQQEIASIPAGLEENQDQKLSAELRRIHREIAALRADLDKPDLQDVFSGLGYILGLFGVAAFVASRRKGGQ